MRTKIWMLIVGCLLLVVGVDALFILLFIRWLATQIVLRTLGVLH